MAPPRQSPPPSEVQEPAQPSDSGSEGNRSPSPMAVLPKTGYFALADPNQEVYSRVGERFDPAKKGGRYKPEFIWNTDWQKTLQMQESLERRRAAALEGGTAPTTPTGPAPKGAVSFSRLADLDRMDVDLSEALRPKPRETDASAAATPRAAAAASARRPTPPVRAPRPPRAAAGPRTVPLPRNDVKRLERSNRASRSMVTTVVSSRPEDELAKAEQAAAELARYEQDKVEQRAWVAAFAVVGAASTYAVYGREVCASYALGALGGYVYLRLLGRSVDGVGAQSLVGGVASALGNQRLLVPIILALGYNRWNSLYAEEYGLHLNLLAILVGFLTYKVALITRQGKQYLDEVSRSMRKEDSEASSS